MYTRIVEFTTKPGKASELCETINDKVLPILKKQTGFVDETVLVSDTESIPPEDDNLVRKEITMPEFSGSFSGRATLQTTSTGRRCGQVDLSQNAPK